MGETPVSSYKELKPIKQTNGLSRMVSTFRSSIKLPKSRTESIKEISSMNERTENNNVDNAHVAQAKVRTYTSFMVR